MTYTVSQVAAELGITRERVHQLLRLTDLQRTLKKHGTAYVLTQMHLDTLRMRQTVNAKHCNQRPIDT
jgi:hypothetical protein